MMLSSLTWLVTGDLELLWGEKWSRKRRTLALVVVPLTPEMLTLLLEGLVLLADGGEAVVESGDGVLAGLGPCACGL